MISEKPNKTIIHFHEKIIDYKSSVGYTTDFLTNLLILSKKKDGANDTTKSHVAEIKAKFSAELSEYSKTLNPKTDNMLEIKLESANETPVMHTSLRSSGVILMIRFQKIDWDEINIFRKFLSRYLMQYFKKATKKSSNEIKQLVSNLSFVIQEFLQNANLYGAGDFGYQLVISHINDTIIISVENYTDPRNAAQLKAIVDEICSTENMHDLILKYMLKSQKHLGLISSVFNKYIDDISCDVNHDNLVKLKAAVELGA